MNRIIEKSALLVICIVGFTFSELSAEPVIGMLFSLALSGAALLFGGTRTADIMVLASALICIPFPIVFCASPLIFYDALWQRKPYLALPALLALRDISSFSTQQLLIAAAGILTAAVMYFRISSLEKSVKAMLALREEAETNNIKLSDSNARLLEAQDNELRLATLRERNRIAREIHDNVGHMLTRSLLQSGALIIINKDEKLKEPLEELKETLNTAMTSIRQSVHDLHDESVDFDAVVRESIGSVSDRFRVRYDNDSGELPVRTRLSFLAVIKEGLSNAVKHSNGDRIFISVREHPAFYQLSVEDNGSCGGISLSESDGIGLQNMRDRIEALGGVINFTASKEGFRIFVSVPKSKGDNR